jgi:hypothetical protein
MLRVEKCLPKEYIWHKYTSPEGLGNEVCTLLSLWIVSKAMTMQSEIYIAKV